MPWLETMPVDQRLDFLTAHRAGGYTMAELCARFGISRKTGYKWLGRFAAEGAHERTHRTLKAETTRPPARNLATQQRAFRAFQQPYNTERPHAARNGTTPASRSVSSPRSYPARLPALAYPGHFTVTMVPNAGTIRFRTKLLFLATALKQHHVGLEETDDGIWSRSLGAVLLGKIDERTMTVHG